MLAQNDSSIHFPPGPDLRLVSGTTLVISLQTLRCICAWLHCQAGGTEPPSPCDPGGAQYLFYSVWLVSGLLTKLERMVDNVTLGPRSVISVTW